MLGMSDKCSAPHTTTTDKMRRYPPCVERSVAGLSSRSHVQAPMSGCRVGKSLKQPESIIQYPVFVQYNSTQLTLVEVCGCMSPTTQLSGVKNLLLT